MVRFFFPVPRITLCVASRRVARSRLRRRTRLKRPRAAVRLRPGSAHSFVARRQPEARLHFRRSGKRMRPRLCADVGRHRAPQPSSSLGDPAEQTKTPPRRAAFSYSRSDKVREGLEEIAFASALGRPGSDLLSRVLRRSIIGAEEFNGRVRNGIGFRPLAIATKPAKRRSENETRGLDFQL